MTLSRVYNAASQWHPRTLGGQDSPESQADLWNIRKIKIFHFYRLSLLDFQMIYLNECDFNFKYCKAGLFYTSDCNVDRVALLPADRLTPVHAAVWWVGLSDDASRTRGGIAPARGAGSGPPRECFPLHFPTSAVQLFATAQRDVVVPEELRPVRGDLKTGCGEGRERERDKKRVKIKKKNRKKIRY